MSKDTKRLIVAKLLWLRESAAKLGAKFNYKGGNFLQSKMFLGGVSLCISLLLGRSSRSTTTRSQRARCATK